MLGLAAPATAQSTTPVPKPFPGSGAPPTSAPSKPAPQTAKPAAATPADPQDAGAIDPRLTGVVIYPGAELLYSFDSGHGQHVFMFGTDMPYSDIVAFYKGRFRTGGSEVFRTPAMHQFDLGPFRSDVMLYRPSIVVKDYTGPESKGYVHVSGTTEKRFRTVIQIVPVVK
jgi:hypothetical protein